jgi:hypothetical protein
MKTYIADEGKVWKKGDEIIGVILYTSDDFNDSDLVQVDEVEDAIDGEEGIR